MAKDLVLITGATGFIGFRTLLTLLEHGYKARIVVRSEEKANIIKTNPAIKALNKDELFEFAVVPDLAQPGSLDAAAKGADAIVHLASPIPRPNITEEQYEEGLIRPAVSNTINALNAAKASGTVKRVVITSSSVAIVPVDEILPSHVPSPAHPPNGDNRPVQPEPPYQGLFAAYVVSKQKALVATDEWVKANDSAGIDVVNLMPPYVIGRNSLAKTPAELFNGTNALFLSLVTGQGDANAPPEVGFAVHVDDVALALVLAVDRQLIQTKNGVANYNLEKALDFNEIPVKAAELFPEAFKSGKLSAGKKPTKLRASDVTKLETDFGFKLKEPVDMIKDVVGQYLELL